MNTLAHSPSFPFPVRPPHDLTRSPKGLEAPDVPLQPPPGALAPRPMGVIPAAPLLLPWKRSAVFRRRACKVTSESAHSRTSLRPYKWVL